MAENNIGRNIAFKIYNADGTPFQNLVLHKATYDSVVMSLGDKITGDVYYKDNTLAVTMQEYIEYKRNPDDENELPVRFVLVNPPTIVREGMVSDNGELKEMTKYSFTFYHPMCLLFNFPFSDVAVTSSQEKYLSQNKSFYWIGNLNDFVEKLNKNLQNTEWVCEIGSTVSGSVSGKLSDVIQFDNKTIADALKIEYETWDVPYIIDTIASTDTRYAQGKRFLIHFGLPSQEILDANSSPFVFQFGKGVGLKNNSRTPRNNKIITRIAGYGSENNIPYGYPQIVWTGDGTWDYTINNADGMQPIEIGGQTVMAMSYPIYDGIVNGQRVRLIKHPFTRNHLMPSIYSETVNKKVNPNALGYNPNIEIKDYYDAVSSQAYTYPNPINPLAPSYDIHAFDNIKPELGQMGIAGVEAYDQEHSDSISVSDCTALLKDYYTESTNETEKAQIQHIISVLASVVQDGSTGEDGSYKYDWNITSDSYYAYLVFASSGLNFSYTVLRAAQTPTPVWDDTMDDDGNYKQSYFKVVLPQLSFDLYACAAITEEMSINMRSGACIGCTFPVMIDWDDYKQNFYDANGNFDPVIGQGHPRNGDKYPNSASGSITVIVQKDLNTFGTIMPNRYQMPYTNDQFVILGISLPLTYVTNAEQRLDAEMLAYMKENNDYYFDYPLKFDEHFLATHTNILSQMKCNTIVRFNYAGNTYALYIKQMSVKWGQSPLPQYDITLTDDVDVVLNPVGKVADDLSKLGVFINQGEFIDYDMLFAKMDEHNDQRYLSKISDDAASGLIRFIRGMQVGQRFVTGLLGEGGIFRREADGTTYLECDKMYVRMKAYFDTVEIRKFLHSGGNRIASLAGIKCSRVEYIDTDGNVTQDVTEAVKFRCYFRADNNGETVTNDFEIGDLAFCKETNADVATGVEQHGYWRAVVGKNSVLTDSGEGWIDLSVTDCLAGSDVPKAQDDIIQLGNKTDKTRQGAIVEYVGGADAPSYQIYQNINTYSLENKNYIAMGYSSFTGRAYLNVYGDFRFGSKTDNGSYVSYNSNTGVLNIKGIINAQSTIGNQTIEQYIKSHQNNYDDSWIQPALDGIQEQIDGAIDTWFYDYMPVATDASGAPANRVPLITRTVDSQQVPVLPYYDWYMADGGGTASEVTTERDKHLGDIFYDNASGYAFRFSYDEENGVFQWVEITDSAVIKALQDAAKAQDTADHKRRIFLAQPVPPYDAGDLWVNATYVDQTTSQTLYSNDILKCITTKAENQSFDIADWTLASKYTDDTYAHGFDYLSAAMGGDTVIAGGLVLSNMLVLRNLPVSPATTGDIMSGINGVVSQTLGLKSIAAWYGGDIVDLENLSDYWTQEQIDNWDAMTESDKAASVLVAKSLFRFDGTGYLAGGNIKWNADGSGSVAGGNIAWNSQGNITRLNGQEISATTITIGGHDVSTEDWVTRNFVSKAFFTALFAALKSDGTEIPVNDANVATFLNSIKARVGLWTESYMSAFGLNSSGGGGGGASTLHDLNDVDILSPMPQSYDGYVLTYNAATGKWTSSPAAQTGISNIAMTVPTGFSVAPSSLTSSGTFAITFASGYSLPLTADVNKGVTAYGWGNHASAGYLTSSALSSYLPLSGGTITGNLTVNGTLTVNGQSKFRCGYFYGTNPELGALGIGTFAINAYSSTRVEYGLYIWDDYGNGTAKLQSGYENGNTNALGLALQPLGGKVGVGYSGDVRKLDYTLSVNGSINGTSVYYNGNACIHAGNIGSQSVNYATSSGSCSGNAATATSATTASKLSTVSKTAWGRTYWTANGVPDSISGALESVTNIEMSGYIKIGSVYLTYDSGNNALRVSANSDGTGAANFYAQGGIAALGSTGSGGGGGGQGDVTWALLADNTDTRQIALSHLTTALSGYATQSWVMQQISGVGGGTVTRVDIGTTQYNPTNGVVSLPAYPTSLPASDVSAWAKASTKPSYSFSEITGTAAASQIPDLNASKITSGTFAAARIPDLSGTYAAVGRVNTLEGYFTNGVANSAAKLSTASKVLFGNTYWTSGGVPTSIGYDASHTANLSYVGNIDSLLYFNTTNSTVGIGTSSPSYKLHVNGTIGVNGNTTLSGALTCSATATFGANVEASSPSCSIVGFINLELNTRGGLAGYGGFIDFHYEGSAADYTARIIEDAVGVLNITAKNATSPYNYRNAGLKVGEDVDGSFVQIGNIRLVYVSSYDAIKVCKIVNGSEVAANLYATGGISALGLSTGGSVSNLTVTNILHIGDSSNDIFYNYDDDELTISSGSGDIALKGSITMRGRNTGLRSINTQGGQVLLGGGFLYLTNSVYLFTDGSNVKVHINNTDYTLYKV